MAIIVRELTDWFSRQAGREQRIVVLEDALLGNRFWAYAFYRLRLFFPRFGAESIIHVIRVALLFQIFSQSEFVLIVLVHATAGLVHSFWWGSLEVMRSRVRSLYRSGESHRIPKEIERWLSLSIRLSVSTMATAAVWAAWKVAYQGGTFGASDLYVIFVFFRLALDFVSVSYHSGIYSIRRVYRPLAAIVGVELSSFGAVLALWPLLGSWSFPLAAIISSALVTVMTVHYSRRAYRFFGLAPRFTNFRGLRITLGESKKDWLWGGLSYSIISMDSLLVLALFGISPSTIEATTLFALFFIVGPTVRAGVEWARLFYFDLKRLEIRPFGNLRARFQKSVIRLAWLLAFLFWGIASVIATVVYQRSLGELYWLLIPFFVSRSLLAAIQIKAFTEEAYGNLLRSGAFFVACLVGLSFLIAGEHEQIVLLSAITFGTLGLLLHRQKATREDASGPKTLYPLEWLTEVRQVEEPVRIWVVQAHAGSDGAGQGSAKQWADNSWKYRQMAERIAARLARSGKVTLMHPNRVAWYERVNISQGVTEDWLLAQLGGLVRLISDTGILSSGAAALDAACGRNLMGDDFREASSEKNGPVGPSEVRRVFEQMFPEGIVYDPFDGRRTLRDIIPSRVRRIVIAEAVAFLRDFRIVMRRSPFYVTAFCFAGELRLLFLVDKRTDMGSILLWRRLLKQFNLRAALGSLAFENRIP